MDFTLPTVINSAAGGKLNITTCDISTKAKRAKALKMVQRAIALSMRPAVMTGSVDVCVTLHPKTAQIRRGLRKALATSTDLIITALVASGRITQEPYSVRMVLGSQCKDPHIAVSILTT